jgi:hypothetical protein
MPETDPDPAAQIINGKYRTNRYIRIRDSAYTKPVLDLCLGFFVQCNSENNLV